MTSNHNHNNYNKNSFSDPLNLLFGQFWRFFEKGKVPWVNGDQVTELLLKFLWSLNHAQLHFIG